MQAAELDEQDPLAHFRERFLIDDPELIYLDGNSLGRLPLQSEEQLARAVHEEWGGGLVRAWNDSWIDLPRRLGVKLARLVGGDPGEVMLADSTSVNLFKLALAALQACPGRSRIVTDDLNFPSDLYVLQSAARLCDPPIQVEVVSSPDGIHLPAELIEEAIDEQTALLSLSHVAFKSAYLHPMHRLTRAAHGAGALVLWDLSHSAGAVPIDLRGSEADLAVGCTYKYLNGGPGSPAFLYVRKELQEVLQNPIQGWFAHRGPFDFSLDYQPAPGIQCFATGTPPILSLRAVETGLDLVGEAGLSAIREKSILQTRFLVERWESQLEPLGYRLKSPRDPQLRGSHISLGHDHGLAIDRALIAKKVVPDFRHPDNIRLGLSPLYTTFTEIERAVEQLQKVACEKDYRNYSGVIDRVT